MNRLDRFVQRFVRDLTIGPPNRPPRGRPETVEPGERATVTARKLVVAYALAIVLPAATAAMLIPFRADHDRTTAIVLVVPVVLVAVLGATGPALTAAVSAAVTYDLLLTQPYYQPVIDDPDEVVATITLVVVGATVGLLSSRLVRITARDAARRTELRHLLDFARATALYHGPDELADSACDHISAVLGLRTCRWHAGYHGGGGAILHADGSVSGNLGVLEPDRAELPHAVELPAVTGATELGRFILTPMSGRITSWEERRTAATIAQLFATAVDHPG